MESENNDIVYYLVEDNFDYDGDLCCDNIDKFLDNLELLDTVLEPTYDLNEASVFYSKDEAIYSYVASYNPSEYVGFKKIEVLESRVLDIVCDYVRLIEHNKKENTFTLLSCDDVTESLFFASRDIKKFEKIHDEKHPFIKNLIDKHNEILNKIIDMNDNVIKLVIHFEIGDIPDTHIIIVNKNSLYYKNDKELKKVGKNFRIGNSIMNTEITSFKNFVINSLMEIPRQACGYTIHKPLIECGVDCFSEDYNKKIYYKIYSANLVKDGDNVYIDYFTPKRICDNMVEADTNIKVGVLDNFIYCNLKDEKDILCGFDLL